MKFAGVCLIAENVQSLYPFYREVSGQDGLWEGNEHVDFPNLGIAIFSVQGMESMAPGSTTGTGSGRAIVSFNVDDVDTLAQTLPKFGAALIKPPQDHPWGLRSVWLKDPDGNILSLRSPVR